MRAKDLKEMHIPTELAQVAGIAIRDARSADVIKKSDIKPTIARLSEDPHAFLEDVHFGELAARLIEIRGQEPDYVPREELASYKEWDGGVKTAPCIDPDHCTSQNIPFDPNKLCDNCEQRLAWAKSCEQMENSCALPVSHRGALMPDAHLGYGLPIGGVLGVKNAVIPFAVGVDIACRMKMSVYPMSPIILDQERRKFRQILETETRFGVGIAFQKKREHPVMDEDWRINAIVRRNKDRAWAQLGTSGSGNHFVEFGTLTVGENNELGLEPGTYLALLSHSGSRGVGASVAHHYSKLAQSRHPELPKELQHLAYLSLDTHEGQEYWEAMQLMGKYAAANHDCIHRHVAQALGVEVVLDIENHHNFAWKEEHDGQELIVHRKGATPAGSGVLGIIPGDMVRPAYVVKGLGNPASLNSASHGAGRKMSRTAAKRRFTWKDATRFIKSHGVELMSAGLDEVPMAYKDIREVMRAQTDLVVPLAEFQPKLVRMAEDGERPED